VAHFPISLHYMQSLEGLRGLSQLLSSSLPTIIFDEHL